MYSRADLNGPNNRLSSSASILLSSSMGPTDSHRGPTNNLSLGMGAASEQYRHLLAALEHVSYLCYLNCRQTAACPLACPSKYNQLLWDPRVNRWRSHGPQARGILVREERNRYGAASLKINRFWWARSVDVILRRRIRQTQVTPLTGM